MDDPNPKKKTYNNGIYTGMEKVSAVYLSRAAIFMSQLLRSIMFFFTFASNSLRTGAAIESTMTSHVLFVMMDSSKLSNLRQPYK